MQKRKLLKSEREKLNEYSKELCKKYFKDDEGNRFVLTATQAEIFSSVYFKLEPRVAVLTATQYGKSTVVAMAVILRSLHKRDDFILLGGSEKKARIIMDKVIQHLFDSKEIYKNLEYDHNESLEKLKHRKNRNYITWRRGGSIKILTANSNNTNAVKEAVTGEGGKNIIEDEASLIPDDLQGMIMRMLGDIEGTFLLKIGNAVYRNHFYKSVNSGRYETITVDWRKALKEGRYSKEYIEEMREEMTPDLFASFYECVFPNRDEIDENGYRYLFTDKLMENVFIDELTEEYKSDDKILGVDVGRGSDTSDFVVKLPKVLYLESSNNSKDTMTQVNEIKRINPKKCFVDDIGVGGGVTDRAREVVGKRVKGISWNEKAEDSKRFKNKKAENYWRMYEFLKAGGKIVRHKNWDELLEIKYKIATDNRIMIEPKDDMIKRGFKSPNTADAGALCFNIKKIKKSTLVIV